MCNNFMINHASFDCWYKKRSKENFKKIQENSRKY